MVLSLCELTLKSLINIDERKSNFNFGKQKLNRHYSLISTGLQHRTNL